MFPAGVTTRNEPSDSVPTKYMLPMILWGGNCLVCCSLVPMFRLNNSRVVQTFVCAQTSVALIAKAPMQEKILSMCSRMGTEYHARPEAATSFRALLLEYGAFHVRPELEQD